MTETLRAERLRTVHLVPITAFDVHLRLALPPMQRLAERTVDAGIRVLIPCAGSAEFHSLSAAEIVSTISAVRDTVDNRAVIVAPIGGALHEAMRLAEDCERAGADAILVMPLMFPYLSNAGAEDYYRRLADESNLPVLIYKKAPIPSDPLLLKLAEHDNVMGVKYAVNDIDAFRRIVADDGGRIEWFCGSAERFAPFFMLAGASGYTSGAANLCPRLTLAMHAAIVAGDWNRALHLQQVIRPIEDYRARDDSSYNISFLKYAISHTGLDFGATRPPQRRLTAEEMSEIDEMLTPIFHAEAELHV